MNNSMILRLFAVFAVVLGLSQAALAAQTGELQGYIVDDSGLPIPGVRVILTSPQQIGGEQVQLSDADGRFRFARLTPGVYTVVLSNAKYRGFTEENIQVGIDATVIRDYLLEPADAGVEGDANTIRVTATAPIVDTTRTSQGLSIRPALTDRTATGRTYQDVALLTPGTVDGSDAPGNPSIHGGTAYSNVYLLDGLNITDPVSSTFSTNFNFDAIGELQVLTGGLPAEYGSTSGGVLNIVTKSGGDEFHLDSSIYVSPKELILLDPGEVNDSSDTSVNVSVGGPIIRKKLWFYVSGQYVDAQSQTALLNPIFPGVTSIPPRRFNGFYGLGKLTWAVTPWQKLSLLMQSDPSWITNTSQSASVHPDAEEQQFQGGVKIVLRSDTTLSENLAWTTTLGYGGDTIQTFPMSNNFDLPAHSNQATGTATINDSTVFKDRRYRLQLQTALTYFLDDFIGDHEIKTGVDALYTANPSEQFVTGSPENCFGAKGGCTFTDNGISRVGSSIDGVGDPFQVTLYDAPLKKTVSANQVSLYAQDTWRPFRSLTINPGLRFDSSRAYLDPEDGGELFNFNTLSPRLGVAWDPFGDQKTVVRGGYYMYNETGLLFLPSVIGRSIRSTTYEYDEVTQKYSKRVQSSGGPGDFLYKDDMRAPQMHEVIFGVQREIFDDAALAVDFTWRRRQNMFDDDESNIQWNRDGSDAVGFRNGEARPIFSAGTPDIAQGQYVGVDFLFEKRLSDNWQALVTYTLSKLEGNVNDGVGVTGALDNPRQRQFEYGYLDDDVRHKLAGTFSYDLPYGFLVGTTATYHSGRPYSKLFFNKFYNDYMDLRARRGFDPKDINNPNDDVELREPDFFQVDARIAWTLKELTTQDIWLIADVFNVFNNRPITAFENRDLPEGGDGNHFGDALARGGPTSVTLALRYMF
jgi:hypothetical protein